MENVKEIELRCKYCLCVIKSGYACNQCQKQFDVDFCTTVEDEQKIDEELDLDDDE